jgi:hypothetical protein
MAGFMNLGSLDENFKAGFPQIRDGSRPTKFLAGMQRGTKADLGYILPMKFKLKAPGPMSSDFSVPSSNLSTIFK